MFLSPTNSMTVLTVVHTKGLSAGRTWSKKKRSISMAATPVRMPSGLIRQYRISKCFIRINLSNSWDRKEGVYNSI